MSNINTKVSLDQFVLKTLYYRFKDFIIPLGTIVVCVALFFFVIIPQVQALIALHDSVSTGSQNLAILRQNLQTISNLDDTMLDAYLQTASDALPTDKDFTSVLQALTNAASNAGTSLGDYNFQIGDLVATNAKSVSGQLPLPLQINLKGDMTIARRFMEELKKQLPLSDVNTMSLNANGTITFSLVFYYAPLPKITFDDSAPLPTLSTKDEKLLKSLQVANGSLSPTQTVNQSGAFSQ